VVTLTATVQAGATTLNLGQVNFCDATAASCTDIHLVGTVQLTSAGTAVLRFRPGPGSHSYKAGSITALDKTYDGTSSATIVTRSLSAVLAGDMVTYAGGTATFSDSNAGMGKTVTAVGLYLAGADAGNYAVNSTATTTATISKANQQIS
jgi:hypothetical protein